MTLIVVLLTCALAGMVVVVLLLAVGSRAESARLHGQLAELGARVEAVAASAQDLPRTVAEGSALQARSIADVREHLGRLAEASCYQMQYGFRTGERVDAALFVGGRIVPVDAKFPLEACRRMIEADDDAQVRERRAFRRSLRERVDEIAERYIRPDEGTFDFALMYVPAEAVYYEAVVRDEVFEDAESISAYALGRRVLPVSPHTFYAFLTAVLHGLRGLEVERRSGEILESLSALEQHFDRFRRSYELVGRHLDHAIRQYQESSRLWERASAHLSAAASFGDDNAGAEGRLGPAAGERLPD
jgi:DNA recombination protein RmuC